MANKKSIDVSEILEEAFEIVKRNPEIIGLYVILLVVTLVAGFAIFGSSFLTTMKILSTKTDIFNTFSVMSIIYKVVAFAVVSFIAQAVITGSAISLVVSIKRKRKISIQEALITGLKKSPYLIAGGIVVGLAVAVGFIALIIPGIYLLFRLILYQQACVVDGSIGVKKSWNVTKGHFWDVLVLFLVLVVIGLVVSIIPWIGWLVNYLFVSPWAITAWTVLYLKLRK